MFTMGGSIMAIYGYARVSTDGQTLDAQQDQLKQAGAEKVFSEKVSGAKTDREELRKLIKKLQQDDVLLVTKLDRLARSLRDILNVLQTISDKGAKFKVLNNPAMDTTTSMGKFLMQVLGSFAELERDLILQRTGEGRVRAKAKGVRFGPKFKLTIHQQQEAIQRREAGETLVDIARSYNVSHPTILRLIERR
jgi:DNA invertase Pin-like site-specific DNA recombinase